MDVKPKWNLTSSHPVPSRQWGRDHLSTFLYVVSRVDSYHGLLCHDHMRCDPDRHPTFAAARTHPTGPKKYPSYIKSPGSDYGTITLNNHDDYDCLADLIAHRMVTVTMPQPKIRGNAFVDVTGKAVTFHGEVLRPAFVTGLVEAQLMTRAHFDITPSGRTLARRLQAHEVLSDAVLRTFVV